MVNLENSIKSLFREDNVHKNIVLTFPALNLVIENEQISAESLSLTESISSGDSLEFGSCNSSIFKITVADVEEELAGQEFTAVLEIGTGSIQLGTFIVASCEKQTDMRLKDITAYDRMSKFDVDVSDWWKGLTFDSNLTVKAFREALCTQCGVPFQEQTLCNDSILVEKTISVSSMTGRDLMKACMEVNGAFGQIDRTGTFKAIVLNTTSQETYTASDYSSEDIPKHSDYVVEAIDKVQIKSEEDDIGGIYGTGTNALILDSNFICYGKSTESLNTIASNIYDVVSTVTYTALDGNLTGLPYVEVGDRITFPAGYSYVLNRTLTGIQSLRDSISSPGTETRSEIADVNSTFERIKALTHIIKNTVDELSSVISNEETGLQTIVSQLENSIDLEVVKKGDVIAAINASEEEIQILANKISLQGFVTFEDLEGNEQVTINGGVFTGATIEGQYASILEINCPGASIGDPKIDMTEGKINVGRPGLLGKATKIEDGKLILQNSSTDSNKTVLDGDSLSVQTATIGGTNFATHNHSTGGTINASLSSTSNGKGDYIRYLNSGQGATTGWCAATFQQATASDMRLKKDILPLANADDIYKNFKAKSYRFKDSKEDGKTHYGLLAQQVIKNLVDNGIDYRDNALIEEVPNLPGRDDGMYCKDGKYFRINYQELHGLHIATIQSLMKRVEELEKKIK